MASDSVIPMLPCVSLEETLGFYRALGFEVTHEQTWPYTYGAVSRNGVDLHFYGGFKGFDPAKSYASCLVMVDDIEAPHREFFDGLRRAFGRIPTAGIPRITRLRKGQTRFGIFDPAGTSLIFIARSEPEMSYDDGSNSDMGKSRLATALDTAVWFRDIRGFDDVAAARVLDKALARNEPAPPLDRARAIATRAELAVALGDTDRARTLRAELQQVPLSDEERERFKDELQAADDLERLLLTSALESNHSHATV
jgi:hypothetical protein